MWEAGVSDGRAAPSPPIVLHNIYKDVLGFLSLIIGYFTYSPNFFFLFLLIPFSEFYIYVHLDLVRGGVGPPPPSRTHISYNTLPKNQPFLLI